MAEKAVTGIVKVLSTDIVTIEGKVYRKIRLKEPRTTKDGALILTKGGRVSMRTIERFDPIDVSAHVNPIGLGFLAAGGAIAAAILFAKVKVGILGIGEVELYKGPLADEFEAWKARRKGP